MFTFPPLLLTDSVGATSGSLSLTRTGNRLSTVNRINLINLINRYH